MTTYIIFAVILIITFALGMYLMPYVSSISKELHLYDMPDSRKVHKLPIPRTGGSRRSLRLLRIHIVNIILYFNKWGWWRDKERKEINRNVMEQIGGAL